MAWAFSWLGSWDEVWDPGHLALWRGLVEDPSSAATPFMHPAVVRAWVGALGGERRFAAHFLHATHDDGRGGGQRVLWPLVRPRAGWRQGFLRRLIPVGTAVNPFGSMGMLFDYHDPIATPAGPPGTRLAPGFWPALLAELDRHQGSWFDVCSLPRLRSDCLGDSDLGTLYDVAPVLRLGPYPDFEAYLTARSPKMRATVRRQLRRLAAAGEVEFRVHGPGETESVLAWLPRLEEERQRRWKGRGLPPGYLAALVREGLPAGVVHASVLRLDGADLAWDLSFYLGGTYYGYIRGFDPAFRDLSPGSLHFCRLLEWLFADGAHSFDFMLGAEAYKYDWADGNETAVRSLSLESRALPSPLRRTAAQGLFRLLQPQRAARRAAKRTEAGRRPRLPIS